MSGEYSLSDIAAATGGNNSGFGGNDGGWWIILLFIFIAAFGGWGNNNGNGSNGSGGGTYLGENYALITDNATLERKIDGVYAGICDSTYALTNNLNNGFASAQNTMTQGFAGLNTALVQQGYETRNAVTQDTIANMQNTNLLQGAIKDCCCQTQQNLADVRYTIGATGADIGRQVERGFSDTNYAMASQNCATLQAIDKVGDRVIDYLAQQETQRLRDDNQALRLAASQQAQNAYLVNELRPCPIPAYITCNPFAQTNYTNGCCGCNA